MTSPPKVAVAILCWNGRKFLESFLPAVIQSTYPALEIVVIDNASTDDSKSFLKQSFPEIRVIEIAANEGFARGYNLGIAQIDAEYIVLLNQDVEVTPGWIEPMVAMMESDQEIGAAQPKILSQKMKDHFEYAGGAGGMIDSLGYTFCRGRIFDTIENDDGQYDDICEIFWVSGAAMFVRRSVFMALGGLDESFFAHMEEIDFCWRMKNAGFKLMYCPASSVYHVGGGSLPQGNPRKTYLNFRNNLAMLIKNYSGKFFWPTLMIRFWLDNIAILQAIVKRQWGDVRAIMLAIYGVLFHLPEKLGQRKIAWQQVAQSKIGKPRQAGRYKRSLVWDYFIRRRTKFSHLKHSAFSD